MEPHGQTGFLLCAQVGGDGIHVQSGNLRVMPETGHIAGGMPCRSGCKVRAFQQQGLVPSPFCEPEEDAASDNPSANDGDTDMICHDSPRQFQEGSRWIA